MSGYTKSIMFEHVFAEVSDETLAAAYAERGDLRELSRRSMQWRAEDDHDDFLLRKRQTLGGAPLR